MEEYLTGVEAELSEDINRALDHYQFVLEDRPSSFWANYRAAAIEFRLQRHATAAYHLRKCVEQRPGSAVLRHQYASCLYGAGDFQNAQDQFDKAQNLDPDHAETYLSRAFLSAKTSQPQNIVRDIHQFDLLKGGSSPSKTSPMNLTLAEDNAEGVLNNPVQLGQPRSDADTIIARAQLAYELMTAGQAEIALSQFQRILLEDPENLRAHYNCGVLLLRLHRDGAAREFSRVVEHPLVETWIQEYPDAIFAFLHVASFRIRAGKFRDALFAATRAAEFADLHGKFELESHFTLGRVYAHLAKENSRYRRFARVELERAKSLDRHEQISGWLAYDPNFGGIVDNLEAIR